MAYGARYLGHPEHFKRMKEGCGFFVMFQQFSAASLFNP